MTVPTEVWAAAGALLIAVADELRARRRAAEARRDRAELLAEAARRGTDG